MAKAKIDLKRRKEIGEERKTRTRSKILSAAFDLFGNKNGLYTRVEDITSAAQITRTTFYAHFCSMDELREALCHEVTHEFLSRVLRVLGEIEDPAEQTATAIRYYLKRAQADRMWAQSMINISTGGFLFGAETARQALATIQGGIDAGIFNVRSAVIGRDLVLGTTFGAICSILRDEADEDCPEYMAFYTLIALGVAAEWAARVVEAPLPMLPEGEASASAA